MDGIRGVEEEGKGVLVGIGDEVIEGGVDVTGVEVGGGGVDELGGNGGDEVGGGGVDEVGGGGGDEVGGGVLDGNGEEVTASAGASDGSNACSAKLWQLAALASELLTK